MEKSLIKIDVEAKDKYEAVIKTGELMLENDYIEERYIQAMVKTLDDFGPYIVITKGVAIPHARPEEGAKKSGFCILRLKNAVKFGNEDNDPVKVLIGLSALGNDEHLKNIQDVISLLDNEENMNILLNGSLDDIYKILERR